MSRCRPILAMVAVLSLGLVACGGTATGAGPSSSASESTAASSQATLPAPSASSSPARTTAPLPVVSPTPVPSPAACPPPDTDGGAACQLVLGTANIFGAGHDEPPAPGGGGAGVLPPLWPVPAGMTTMIVTETSGLVQPIDLFPGKYGAGGDLTGPTDVTSTGGISGIVHHENGIFLVGVFLTDEAPSAPGPERLDFTGEDDFAELAPEIGQTFFIGDGVDRTFIVPTGATRLFLGFADGYLYKGAPGWYGNNRGKLAVSVEFRED